jgi:hypothetical protein
MLADRVENVNDELSEVKLEHYRSKNRKDSDRQDDYLYGIATMIPFVMMIPDRHQYTPLFELGSILARPLHGCQA